MIDAPRYRFTETGVGCATHDDPACLCDVHVGKPAPIVVNVHHMFHTTALDVVDADGVDARNFYEFSQVVLGLWELWSKLDPSENANAECVMCGRQMVSASPNRLTCSQSCRNKKSRLERKARQNAV